MNKLLLLFVAICITAYSYATASLKITFSGDDSYVVNVDGFKHYVDNQYLQLEHLSQGNHSLKFFVRHGMTTILVHTTDLYLQDNTETIAIFENSVLKVKSVNTMNTNVFVGGGTNTWTSNNHFSNTDFQAVLEEVEDESFDSKKADKIVSLIKHGYISAGQGKQLLETFSFDSERYDAAIAMIPYVHDQQNLWQLGETFTFSTNKDEYLDHINSMPGSTTTGSGNNNTWTVSHTTSYGSYGMDAASFNQLYEKVEDEAFDSNKPELILTSVKHTTITTAQAVALLETFSFDSHRLDAAKEMTPYISDRHNYWQAGEAFTFNSNKDEFLEYIK
jgi:hypothetical protein